ncbi:MAG TPA: peptide ABC transporter substrate-binding protein [Candidatus Nitrosocosmicus sp.]|nr:peptide ABC transporter substrate-binding protein [Candidatus Nitrosocosmicus sp.]
MKKSLVFTLAMVLILSIALTACGTKTADTPAAPTPGEQAKEPQELTINLFQEAESLDWQEMSSTGSIQIYNWVMEGLTRSAGKGTVKPGIAEKWETSTDGKVWTFHLRDAKWTDGTPVTANDFKYGAMRALDPKTPRDYTYFLYDIVGAEEYSTGKGSAEQVGIKVIDDKTIEYTLKQPVTYFDYLVSFPTYAPVQQAFAEKVGDKFNTETECFLTNGPFKIESWQREAEMVFVKNPEYWDAASIKLDKVIGLMITETSTEFNMYESGELDHTIQLDADQKSAMTKGSVGNYSEGSVWFFDFNCTHPVLKNKNIRKALTYAIDRQSFIENVARQPWKPATAFIQPDIIPDVDGKTPWRAAKPSYFKDNDVETAKALLAQGMQELGLTTLPKMKFMCNDQSIAQTYAQAFQEMWKKNLGIEVEIEPVPSAVRIDRQQAHDYDISLGGWGPDYPDPMTDLDLYVTGAGNNDPAYSNPEYDALIKAAKAEPDKAKKYEMMRKAEDILMDDMPIGPLYYRYRDYAVREYVKGFVRDSFAPDIQFIYAWIEGKSN